MIGEIEGIKIYVNNETYTKYKKTLEDEIDELQQENKQLKKELKATKEVVEEHLKKEIQLKEVIDEVRKFIEDWLFDAGGNGASMTYEDINELLQILDKLKD